MVKWRMRGKFRAIFFFSAYYSYFKILVLFHPKMVSIIEESCVNGWTFFFLVNYKTLLNYIKYELKSTHLYTKFIDRETQYFLKIASSPKDLFIHCDFEKYLFWFRIILDTTVIHEDITDNSHTPYI